MTTAQVVETSVTVNDNSPIQDYVNPDDQTQPTIILLLLIFLCRDGQLYVVILRNQQRSATPGPVGAEIVLYQLQRFVDLYLNALIHFESTHYNIIGSLMS